jgi:predicted MFS family arabinose efflux permease
VSRRGRSAELGRGFTALCQDRPLRVLAIAVLVIAAIYMPTEAVVLPAYFNALGDPTGLGIVIAAISGGAMIGASGYGWILARVRPSVLVRNILIGTTLSVLPMTLLPPLPVLAAFGFLLGLVWGPFNPLFSTLVQRRIRPEEQGRVYGVQLAGLYAAPPIGMVIAGISVDALGVAVTYLALGALLAACATPIVVLRSDLDLDHERE